MCRKQMRKIERDRNRDTLRKKKYILGKGKGVLETGKEYFRIKFEFHKIIYFEMEGENFKLQMPS